MGSISNYKPVYSYMPHDDLLQVTLLSLIQIAANILHDRSKPMSRRENRIKALKEQVECIDQTFTGCLPEWWIPESASFNSKLEKLLNQTLIKYRQMDDKPKIVRDNKGKFRRQEVAQAQS